LASISDLKRVHAKAKGLIAQIQEVHQMTTQKLQESTAKYKASADKKRAIEFDGGDFACAVLTKDHFLVGEYNKLAGKIGPIEIIEKINFNAYRLKHLSNIRTSNIFNVKHLVPFTGDSSDEELNSRENSLQPTWGGWCRSGHV